MGKTSQICLLSQSGIDVLVLENFMVKKTERWSLIGER
jgi:hypothetical protein